MLTEKPREIEREREGKKENTVRYNREGLPMVETDATTGDRIAFSLAESRFTS